MILSNLFEMLLLSKVCPIFSLKMTESYIFVMVSSEINVILLLFYLSILGQFMFYLNTLCFATLLDCWTYLNMIMDQ